MKSLGSRKIVRSGGGGNPSSPAGMLEIEVIECCFQLHILITASFPTKLPHWA